MCAVDFMGPVGLLVRVGRYPRIEKGYVCVFVCCVSRAIHLELVSDASTAQFMQALRHMIAKRGPVVEMWSNNGTNFTGANNQLKQIFSHKIATHVGKNPKIAFEKVGYVASWWAP